VSTEDVDDSLRTEMPTIYISPAATSAELRYAWYMWSEEWFASLFPYDYLYIRLRDRPDNPTIEITLDVKGDNDAEGVWQQDTIDLLDPRYGVPRGVSLYLYFEADLDDSGPTGFFVDDVQLWTCEP